MMIFDLFYYVNYRFANDLLKRGRDNSRISAAGVLATYLGFSSILILCILGLIVDNPISRWATSTVNKSVIVMLFVAMPIYIYWGYFRYSKVIDFEDIDKKIKRMSKMRKNFYKILVIIVMLAVPICYFIFYRLYVLGHVKWW